MIPVCHLSLFGKPIKLTRRTMIYESSVAHIGYGGMGGGGGMKVTHR